MTPAFDLYPGPRSGRPLLVFVHGGAWRSDDKAQHAALARALVAAARCPVAVPNYTLTPPDNSDPRFFHPAHAADLLAFLRSITAAPPPAIDPDNILLIGHSCSAHIIASILLDSQEPALADPRVCAAVKGVVCSEGIFDLDALLARFPAYRAWFVASAFGDRTHYALFNAARFDLRQGPQQEWLLLHSRPDSLVDPAQSEAMYAHLSALLPPGAATLDLDTLTEEHDDVLESDAYVARVAAFAARVFPLA